MKCNCANLNIRVNPKFNFYLQVGQLNNEVDKHNRLTPEERQEISESVQKVSQQWDELNNLLDGSSIVNTANI